MEFEKRYLFQGHAIAASAHFRRFKDQELHVDNCLKNCSAAVAAQGGCLTSSSGRQEIRNGDHVLLAFDSASAHVTGDYIDRHAAFERTLQGQPHGESGVVTACEATLNNVSVLNRFHAGHLRAQLTAEDLGEGSPVRFFAKKAPLIEGVVLENKPIKVEIDVDDIFLRLATKQEVVDEQARNPLLRPCSSGGNYIVTSIVNRLVFPDGLPRGVEVVGHNVLKVENFGRIFFGELIIGETTRRLTLVRFQLGSDTGGTVCLAESKPNGETT